MNNEELEKYIEERSLKNGSKPSSIEELQTWIHDFETIENNKPIEDFDGLSPRQMYYLLSHLLTSASVLQIKDLQNSDFGEIPLLRQANHLLSILKNEGKIKLTATKALPRKIVKELHALGASQYLIDVGISKLSKEKDSLSVLTLRSLMKLMKLIKIQKGIMLITNKGKRMLDNPQLFLEELLLVYATKFNFGMFDAYTSDSAALEASFYSLFLFSKYGDEKRNARFYADKYYRAFPDILMEFFERPYTSIEEQSINCYIFRTFENYMLHFGLVEIIREKGYWSDTYVIKTALFDKLFHLRISDFTK